MECVCGMTASISFCNVGDKKKKLPFNYYGHFCSHIVPNLSFINLNIKGIVLLSMEIFVIAKAGDRNLAVCSCLSLNVEQCLQ